MASADYEKLEREVKAHLERHEPAAAATLTLQRLGPEIFGFLVSLQRSQDEAAEVFSQFSECLWRGLGSFQGDCSIRTWAYLLARRASLNHRRNERRRARRVRPLDHSSELGELAAEVRSATASYLRSDRQARFAELRRALPLEDQTLLILRVDRQLSWNDLARVLHTNAELDSADALSGAELAREATRLRKRFQLLKQRLLALGREAGVVTTRKEEP